MYVCMYVCIYVVCGWHCGSVRVLALSGHGLNPPFGTLSVCSFRDGRRLKSSSLNITELCCLVPRVFSIKFVPVGSFDHKKNSHIWQQDPEAKSKIREYL